MIAHRRRLLRAVLPFAALAAASLLSPVHSVHAETSDASVAWPRRPIRLIVPFAPGSTPDIVARLVAERLGPRLGQPVYVENKPGAGGNLGTQAIARAAPDGYTLGLTISGPLAANTLLYRRLPYDPRRDFAFVTIAVTQPSILVVPARWGIGSVPALLEALRRQPGRYNFASMGTGSISHLAMEAVAARSGTRIEHVPYTGSAQALASLLAGDTQMAVLPAAAVIGLVRDGRLKALAVATGRRSRVLPSVPTLQEAGIGNVQADAWNGFVFPAGVPPQIVARLHDAVVAIVRAPDVQRRLAALDMEPVGGSPEQFRETVEADLQRWRPIIAAQHITLD